MIACICGNGDAYADTEGIIARICGWVSGWVACSPSIGTALAQARSDSSTLENAHKPRRWCQRLTCLLQPLPGDATDWLDTRGTNSIDRLAR